MAFEVSYTLDNEQQFWDELDEIVSAHCQSHELIDNSLRSYLSFVTNYRGEYLQSEYDVVQCSYKLLESALFTTHADYVRRQIIYSLLQEDSADVLFFITSILLADGRQNEKTFEMMNEEGTFSRLVELIQSMREGDLFLHRMLLELLYEMSRIQRLRFEDLISVEDEFVTYLLEIIECLSDDVNDPYHYPVIRVLLVLNEQYMVLAHDPSPDQVQTHLPNKVIKALSLHGSAYKTFGENIILLLNRESETSLQLLILKLLYLLFTTPPTYEYFYTNDLRVLVDVMIRNLLDLPHSSTALRHTYLRVLYPLLAHTQLKLADCHYKRYELLRLLHLIGGDNGSVGNVHFGGVDETTKRLAGRCVNVEWLQQGDPESPNLDRNGNTNRYLGIGGNARAAESSLSVLEVAAQHERPGVQTPSNSGLLRRRASNADTSLTEDNAANTEKANEDGSLGNGVSIPVLASVSVSVNTNPTIANAGGEDGDDVDQTQGVGLVELQSPFEVQGEA
ncbi:MAG: hypothetical protein MMC33_000323 [Icmadophila ericetorum]|nr:hypothetical protein [Icmadophila ericetorum]